MTRIQRNQRNRLAAAAATFLMSLATLAAGVTFGLYSSTPGPETNNFTAGNVTLASNASGACNVTAAAPGDGPTTCTFQASYTGSMSAYLALNVVVETQAGSGGTPLYNPSGSNGMTVSIADNQSTPVTYTVPTTPTTCPTGAPSGSTCYELDNELVGTGGYASGTNVTFTTTANFPLAQGNGYQNGAAQVILTAHAVQAAHNTLACSSTPTAGQPCTPSGSFAWS
jgi:hypothetical protein